MGSPQRAQLGRGTGTLRPHLEYTATDARHSQLIATGPLVTRRAADRRPGPVPQLESSPNYLCRIRQLQHQQQMPVTGLCCWAVSTDGRGSAGRSVEFEVADLGVPDHDCIVHWTRFFCKQKGNSLMTGQRQHYISCRGRFRAASIKSPPRKMTHWPGVDFPLIHLGLLPALVRMADLLLCYLVRFQRTPLLHSH